MKITIDVDDLTDLFLKMGDWKQDELEGFIAGESLEGWSGTLLDALDAKYGLEAAVSGAVQERVESP